MVKGQSQCSNKGAEKKLSTVHTLECLLYSTSRGRRAFFRHGENGVSGQTSGNVFESLLNAISEEKIFVVLSGHHTIVHNGLPVDNSSPVLGAQKNNGKITLDLTSLLQSQHLEKFVHGADATGGNHKGLTVVHHPELSGEKVVVFESKLVAHILVGSLLKGKRDGHADALGSLNHGSSHVSGLHESGTTTSGDNEGLAVILLFILSGLSVVTGNPGNATSLGKLDARVNGPLGQFAGEIGDLVKDGTHPLASLDSLELGLNRG
mmetsp:Transcript_10383/g.22891  ORF Transcript_10383/g.22891 Transcript_10383/m.22891 type:complete len:264 (-) Transcript_10383:112-903(-)